MAPVPPARSGVGGGPSTFIIDFNSWQAGGELTLVFSNSDVVIYNPSQRTGIASINTMRGMVSVHTTADESADHVIWIPADYGPEDITVRIAGRRIPFTPTEYRSGNETFVVIGAEPTDVARISLRLPEGRRPRR